MASTSSDLLAQAVEAHGGLDRQGPERSVRLQSGGFAFAAKGWGLSPRLLEARVTSHEPRTVLFDYPSHGQRGVFEHGAVRIESETGCVEHRGAEDARRSARRSLRWDALDFLYFVGYALWQYICAPFAFVLSGFDVRENGSWLEGQERWRRLVVRFPADVPAHCREQIYYFNQRGLLRRLDYTAEVFGGWARATHYCFGHREFDGIVIPTVRRVHPRLPNGRPLTAITLVSIEIEHAVMPVVEPDGSTIRRHKCSSS